MWTQVCRVLTAALVAAAVVAPAAAPAAAVTHTAAPDAAPAATGPRVTVQLDAISPQIARPGQAVTVRGTIRNTGGAPVAHPTVVARLRTDGLGNREQVTSWAQGSREVTPGPVVAHLALKEPLAAGQTAAFSLTIPSRAVSNPSAFAALPLAIEAAPAGADTPVGTSHTFLPWYQRKEFTPLSLAWLVPLTLDPDPALFGAPGRARTQAWQQAIGPGSRIDRLITGTQAGRVTWFVDPAVLGPPVGASATTPPPTPTSTSTPTTTPTPGTGGTGPVTPPADAVTTLTTSLGSRLAAAGPAHPLWALPYSDPDLAATLGLSPGDPSVATVMATPDQLGAAVGHSVRDDIAWPADGRMTLARESGLRNLFRGNGLTAGVVSASSLPVTDDGVTPSAGRRTPDGLPLLAYDDRLSSLLGGTRSPQETTAVTERFLAETIALLQERPSVRRSALVAASRSFAGDPASVAALLKATAAAPWLTTVSTTDLVHEAVDANAEAGAAVAPHRSADALAPGRSPLTRSTLAELPQTRSSIEGVASVMDPSQFPAGLWQDANAQQLSSRWRGQPRSFATLHNQVVGAVSGVSSGIRVNPATINFLADQGVLQITVVNTLNMPVHDVRLHLEPGSPRLRIDDQPELLRINRGSRVTVKVHVTAVAAGLVPVQASLSSVNGTPIGQGARVDVRVSPTSGWVYWALGVVAGLVLVLGVLRSLRRGRTRPALPPQENVLP
ncbi:hypothetical protein FB474_3961 [Oryzihumus leptocrescens]|uniref:Secreted protein n=2 Tax=Oryzihumus leptocrescens TaxID=297536 RepID=A0A542Z7N0_9MICO|nr:hypothetical protein FB474_3961 [Oryzihumus leptocrescens]